MSGWTIVVDRLADLPPEVTGFEVVRTREYIASARLDPRDAPKVLNLSRSHGYQTLGYYCSLLAEARGQKVVPSVTTMLELRGRTAYAHALPDLEEALNRVVRRLADKPTLSFRLFVCLGLCDDARFQGWARQFFAVFRSPILEIFVQAGEWWRIRRIQPVSIHELGEQGKAQLTAAIKAYTRGRWRTPKAKTAPRRSLAILFDAREKLPPSDMASLRRFERIAEPMGLEVEIIGRRDFDRLPEFDALWIRETTNIDHHTWRFAKRAEQEGMPVIDDPTSILRCTNKVYLAEVLQANDVPTPRTVVIGGLRDLDRLETQLAYPMVLKIPDGSFSRGVHKAAHREELNRIVKLLLEGTDLILAQEFMYTEFDWRVGVLDGEPLFVSQYMMAKKHWQIVRHTEDGRSIEGGFRTLAIADAPADIVMTSVKAAGLIGRGLHGVDLKKNERGVFVIEVNDNPNLTTGVEDAVDKEEVWRRVADWFNKRLA